MSLECSQVALSIRSLRKSFGGVRALQDVSLEIRYGQVHCLVGENGAGKSTLIRILAGATAPDAGEIVLDGSAVKFRSPQESLEHGLAFIFQELAIVPGMSVAQNVCLGREPTRVHVLDRRRANREAAAVLARFGFDEISPRSLASNLAVAHQQAVMMARALWLDARIIFMDEPTAALGRHEVDRLFSVIRQLRSEGRAIVFVSHRLEEVSEIGDRVTVLRDGELVGTLPIKESSEERLIRMMTGRDIEVDAERSRRAPGSPVLEVVSLTSKRVTDVSLTLYEGEILGLGGLVGAGRTELLRAILGLDRATGGFVRLAGSRVRFGGPLEAIRHGVAFVPADRRREALLPNRSVGQNLLLGYEQLPKRLRPSGSMKQLALQQVRDLRIKPGRLDDPILNLSGGNQQKVVLGRWLMTRPKILLLDEPTQGVDVGAKSEIHRLLRQLADAGVALLIVLSDMEELLQLSDRIVVMRGGRIAGELGRTSEEGDVLELAFGG